MDADRFDSVARALTGRASRRALASAFAGSLGLLGLPEVGKVTAKKKPCPPCKTRKKGKCTSNKPDGAACPGGACRRGRCAATRAALGPCGTGCAGGEVCEHGTCRAARCGEVGGSCTVFVTGTGYDANLGGLVGADATCQARADAAGLGGTYKAWLSTVDGSPKTRFAHAPGPYRLVDGTKIADDWVDLTDGVLRHAINIDETGNPLAANTRTWTGTQADGTLTDAGHTCGGWTTTETGSADMGTTARADLFWSWEARFHCWNTDIHLFCFQQA